MQLEKRLRRITRLTTLSIALAIIFFIPLGYFTVGLKYEKKLLAVYSEFNADLISRKIVSNPKAWRSQTGQFKQNLAPAVWQNKHIYYRISDTQQKVLFSVGEAPKRPIFSARAHLLVEGEIVGNIDAQISLTPLLYGTFLSFLLSLAVAWVIFYLLNMLPFAALTRVMKRLEESESKLKIEVDAKENALREYRQVSDAMVYQATHDDLTGLPNRACFTQAFDKNFSSVADNEEAVFSIMIFDLNRFKEINDNLGHPFGDEVIKAVGRRIRQTLPETDLLARLGGDEFAVLLTSSGKKAAIAQAEKIVESVKKHIVVEGYHLSLQGSIGISSYPEHGRTFEELMRHADIAMYCAKQNEKMVCSYEQGYEDNGPDRLILMADLRQTIDNGGLTLFFQPKFSLKSGQVVGVEALVRWTHSEYGAIAPEIFITLAEQAGIIHSLTEWVLETALQQQAAWNKQGLSLDMAVNISSRNLQNDQFTQQVSTMLKKYDLEGAGLTLELTESSIMLDPGKSIERIHNLSELGIKVSIDDYGTGYSSLVYLKKLMIHELKIDKSFICNLLDDDNDQVIVRSTIEMAHNLNLKVVSEGIENTEIYNLLKEQNCDIAQGHYLCDPLPLEQFGKWISGQSIAGQAINGNSDKVISSLHTL